MTSPSALMVADSPRLSPAAAANGTVTRGRHNSTASPATISASNQTSGMINCSICN
jgi:hypothetical protein